MIAVYSFKNISSHTHYSPFIAPMLNVSSPIVMVFCVGSNPAVIPKAKCKGKANHTLREEGYVIATKLTTDFTVLV